MSSSRHAEIAGAGFAGLTAAAALARRGWSVRVHERSPEVRAFGAGIWTRENGVRALTEWETRWRPATEHAQLWSWISWPLTRIPVGVARRAFKTPVFGDWVVAQRRKPSYVVPYGSESDARWFPRTADGDAAARRAR